jgi:hypothetical protein
MPVTSPTLITTSPQDVPVGVRRSPSSVTGKRILGISTTGWAPPNGDMAQSEWLIAGHRLGDISRCNQWWLGDWVRYGMARWGHRYTEAARVTGYDPRSLANMASVASSFPLSRRRDNLTWSHHAAVAALEIGEQDRWLDFAISERLSVSDLRTEIRSRRHKATASNLNVRASTTPDGAILVVCPECGHRMRVNRRTSNSPRSSGVSKDSRRSPCAETHLHSKCDA